VRLFAAAASHLGTCGAGYEKKSNINSGRDFEVSNR
jgi:hypothetical protein